MKIETKVGLMFLLSVILVIAFAYFIGIINPFSNNNTLNLAYNFAGGIEVGSPVRVMGIKVGKVKAIKFVPDQKLPNGEEVKLKIVISISKEAWPTVKKDSQFYINLAGVIGEKFIEVTPGSAAAAEVEPNSLVRGEDPPRIDQLISQSYGLAGKIMSMVEENEGSVVDTINTINRLLKNFNRALNGVDKVMSKNDISKLLNNSIKLTNNLAELSDGAKSPEAKKTIKLINDLIWRLEGVDKEALKKFLQDEGIRARLF